MRTSGRRRGSIESAGSDGDEQGQITIPVEVRRELGLQAGSRVHVVRTGDGSYLLAAATGAVTALRGVLAAPATSASVQQIDDAVAAGAAEGNLR